MSVLDHRLDRRAFLAKATGAAATVAVSAGMVSAAEPAETEKGQAAAIPSRALGKTGLKLPILGILRRSL